MGLEANRIGSTTAGCYEQVGQIELLPEEGLLTHLKGFDFVKVFRTVDTDGHVRPCALYLPDREKCEHISRQQFQELKDKH